VSPYCRVMEGISDLDDKAIDAYLNSDGAVMPPTIAFESSVLKVASHMQNAATDLMNHRGAYAPIGINDKSNPPNTCPISLNAGQHSNSSSLPVNPLGTVRYPVSPANHTLHFDAANDSFVVAAAG
jgi:hypothetical protein